MSGSLESRYPLDGDGLVVNLFHYLWSKDQLGRGPSGVRVPDTVLFRFRVPVAWFFTSKDGSIRRRNRANINPENIEDAFLAKAGACGIVGYFVDLSETAGAQDEEEGTVASPQIQYFDAEGLRKFLRSPRRPMSGMLQRFVEPKGAHSSIVRCVWAPRVFLAERRVNPNRLYDEKVGMYERAVTFEGAAHSSEVLPVRGDALPRRLQGLCESIAFHVAQVTRLRTRVSRLVLATKQDASDRLWVLWASSVRVEGAAMDLQGGGVLREGKSAASILTAGLAPPASAFGAVDLTGEFRVPPSQRARLTSGIRPVLAPGLQTAGATLGGVYTGGEEKVDEEEEGGGRRRRNHEKSGGGGVEEMSVSIRSLPGARGARYSRVPGSTKDAASTLVTDSRAVEPARGPAHVEGGLRLREGQCPSCGAAMGLGKGDERGSGAPVAYRVIMQHYDALCKALDVHPTETGEEEERRRDRTKLDDDGRDPGPAHGARWPADETLLLAAAGGVGVWTVAHQLQQAKVKAREKDAELAQKREARALIDGKMANDDSDDDDEDGDDQEIALSKAPTKTSPEPVGVSTIPPPIQLTHPKLSSSDFSWYRSDPLFLFRSVTVCEACFLVYARFSSVLAEGKPAVHALRECMGPGVRSRVVERDDALAARIAGVQSSPPNNGTRPGSSSSSSFMAGGHTKGSSMHQRSRVEMARNVRGMLRDEAEASTSALRRGAKRLKSHHSASTPSLSKGGGVRGAIKPSSSARHGRRGTALDSIGQLSSTSGGGLFPDDDDLGLSRPSLPPPLTAPSSSTMKRPRLPDPARDAEARAFLDATSALPPGHPLAFLPRSAASLPPTSARPNMNASGTGTDWPARGSTPNYTQPRPNPSRTQSRQKHRRRPDGRGVTMRPLTSTAPSPFAVPLTLADSSFSSSSATKKPLSKTATLSRGRSSKKHSKQRKIPPQPPSLAEQYDPGSTLRSKQSRPQSSQDADRHLSYLAKTKQDLQLPSRRAEATDALHAMTGRNPVQDDAAARIQNGVRRARQTTERNAKISEHMADQKRRDDGPANQRDEEEDEIFVGEDEDGHDASPPPKDMFLDESYQGRLKRAETMGREDADKDAVAPVGVKVAGEVEAWNCMDLGLGSWRAETGVLVTGMTSDPVPTQLRSGDLPVRRPCIVAIRVASAGEYFATEQDQDRVDSAMRRRDLGEDVGDDELVLNGPEGVTVHYRDVRTGRVWRHFVGARDLQRILDQYEADEDDKPRTPTTALPSSLAGSEDTLHLLRLAASSLRDARDGDRISNLGRGEDVFAPGALQRASFPFVPTPYSTVAGHVLAILDGSPTLLVASETDLPSDPAAVGIQPGTGPVRNGRAFHLLLAHLARNQIEALHDQGLAQIVQRLEPARAPARRFLAVLAHARNNNVEWRGSVPSCVQIWTDVVVGCRRRAALSLMRRSPSDPLGGTAVSAPTARALARAVRGCAALGGTPVSVARVLGRRAAHVLGSAELPSIEADEKEEEEEGGGGGMFFGGGGTEGKDGTRQKTLGDREEELVQRSIESEGMMPVGTAVSRVVMREGKTMAYVSLRLSHTPRPQIVLRRHEMDTSESGEGAAAAVETRVLRWSEAADASVNPLLEPAAWDLAAAYGFPTTPQLVWRTEPRTETDPTGAKKVPIPGPQRKCVYRIPIACALRRVGDNAAAARDEAVLLAACLEVPALLKEDHDIKAENARRARLEAAEKRHRDDHAKWNAILQAGKGSGTAGLDALPTASDKQAAEDAIQTALATDGLAKLSPPLDTFHALQDHCARAGFQRPPSPDPANLDADTQAASDPAGTAPDADKPALAVLAIRISTQELNGGGTDGRADPSTPTAWNIGPGTQPPPQNTSIVLENGRIRPNATSLPGNLYASALPDPELIAIPFPRIADPSINPLLEHVQASAEIQD